MTKYPRTPHLPWSPGRTSDDNVLKSIDHLHELPIVITEKMDGENTTLYRDGFHARSLDSRHHPSRDWLAAFHAEIAHEIPDGWRICGEYMYARHSIAYDDLPSYFLGFSIWNAKNICLSWKETLEWFSLLGIQPVNVLWEGRFDINHIRDIANRMPAIAQGKQEGFVIRPANAFHFSRFGEYVCKYVRANHVQTDEHWMYRPVTPNKLRNTHIDGTAKKENN